MDRILKFLRTLSPKFRQRILDAAALIIAQKTENLDVMPLKGKKNWFRCRVGNVRIIFIRLESGVNIIHEIQFRGKAYKKL